MSSADFPLHASVEVPPAISWTDRLHGWVATVDHKRLGVLYVASGLVFLLVGGSPASMMRREDMAWAAADFLPDRTGWVMAGFSPPAKAMAWTMAP